MLSLLIAALVTIFVVKLILKNYKPHTVLLLGGIILMLLTAVLGLGTILPENKATGFILFDIFEFIKLTFSSSGAGLGLIIMSVAGFAKYMDHIGASQALVRLLIKPLQKMNAPYLVLGLSYLFGQILNIFIPSASGLGVLLMATLYPLLVSLGVSPLSATSVIATTACLDLGPASGNANLVARTAGMDAAVYFVTYQLPVAVIVLITVTLLHYIVQKQGDKKMGYVAASESSKKDGDKMDSAIPRAYALLPVVPLFLILIFSKFIISTVRMNVITSMLIGTFISLIFEVLRYRDVKKVFSSLQVFFDEMGVAFARIITLIVAGQTFAQGLKTIGSVDVLINMAQSAGFSAGIIIVIMTGIISLLSIIMGSGNAPFFSFAALAPDLAGKMGISAISMLLPMQFAAGIARSISPITSVIVAVANISDVSPVDVVKRTAIPMAGALIVTVISNFIFFF